ncbi:hypothetical protein T439DRAFT_330327 [Meredithblackwellia eburnea MCA 4105]
MGKVTSRAAVVSQSKDDEPDKDPLNVWYCLCGEFLLVLSSSHPLHSLPRRPMDGAYALRNEGEKKPVYKLNTVGKDGVVVRREVGQGFEFRRPLQCPRCSLPVGYETKPGSAKGPATFILPGSMSEIQNKIPEDAFGLELEGEEKPATEPEA